jgi:hypothetical protein
MIMEGPTTVGEALALLDTSLADLTAISHKAYVHRVKFRLVLEKFRCFVNHFRRHPESSVLTETQMRACSDFRPIIDRLYCHFAGCGEDRWAAPTATTPSCCMPNEISDLCIAFHRQAEILDSSAAGAFNSNPQFWASA